MGALQPPKPSPYSPRSGRSLIGSHGAGAEGWRLECGSVLELARRGQGPAQCPVTHSFLLSLSGLFCVNMYTALSLQAMSGARPLHPNSLGSIPRLWPQIPYRITAGTLMWLHLAPGAATRVSSKLVLTDLTDLSGTLSGIVSRREHSLCTGPLTPLLFTDSCPKVKGLRWQPEATVSAALCQSSVFT